MSVAAAIAPPDTDRVGATQWLIAIVLTMATFMEVLDTTIANVSLPHIAGNLGAGQDESTWVLTSYLVSNAIVLPMSGWLSKAFGRKRFYMSCVALFTASSLLCGLAPNLAMLIFFRVLQGFGGGGLQPSEQAILVDTFPASKRGMAFAVAGVATVCAPVLGPTLGGWITDNYSWRWVFYINVPIGLLSLVLSSQILPNPPDQRAVKDGTHIDFVAMGLVALGIGALQIVLDKGERSDWFESGFIAAMSVVSLVSIIAAIVRILGQKDPLVDLRLLKNGNFAMSAIMMFTLGFVLFGSTVLIPLMLQSLLGYDATWSGLVLSPGGILLIALMPVAGILVGKVQPKFLVCFGLFITAMALLHMTSISLKLDYSTAVKMRCLQVIGLPFLFIPINTAAYAGIPAGKNNNASAILSLSRNIGGSFGIALLATLLSQRTQFHHARLVESITPYSINYQQHSADMVRLLTNHGMTSLQAGHRALGGVARTIQEQASVMSFIDAFWMLSLVMFAAIPFVAIIMRPIDLSKKVKGGH